MKSVIFDFVTGAAIIMGLVIVTRVMKANQFFIESSSQSETEVEQLYIGTYDDEGVELKENTYTVADVYGTLTTLTRSNGALMDKYEFKLKTGGMTYTAFGDIGNLNDKKAQVNTIKSVLEPMLNNPNAYTFKRIKTQKVNSWNCPAIKADGTPCGQTGISGTVWKCPSCGTEKNVDSTVIIYEFIR